MTDPDDRLTPEAESAWEAVMTLREPEPRAVFRARLEREFVTGEITSAPGRGADLAVEPRAPSVRVRPARSGWLGGPWRWAVAAAAVIVATLTVQALNTGPAWRLVASRGEGIATVDGRPIPMNHADGLASALTPGARLRVPPGCEVEIACARTMAIQMTSETDATVPPRPRRWFGRALEAEVHAGEWRITTGPEFKGSRLAITTPAAHVEVMGTTLAVICEPQGTCVCVYEGKVLVGRDASDMVSVSGGRRRYVYLDDTRESDSDVMRPAEAAALPDFNASMEWKMRGGR